MARPNRHSRNNAGRERGTVYVAIHGHGYQPGRVDPEAGTHLDPEDYSARSTALVYGPNALRGNFASGLTFDIGPTLVDKLRADAPVTLQRIVDGDRARHQASAHGPAIAQAMHHAILPLLSERERHLEIEWGLRSFRDLYGRSAEGLWLPECAVDIPTLRSLARSGVQFIVLAEWQRADTGRPREPYWIEIPPENPDGEPQKIAAFFFDQQIWDVFSKSNDPKYDGIYGKTWDWEYFAEYLQGQVDADRRERGEDQLLFWATDLEMYGEHLPGRDAFLEHFLKNASNKELVPVSLATYLADHPPTQTTKIVSPSSWSDFCFMNGGPHGVERWRVGCACAPGDFKKPLRDAFDQLAASFDAVFAERVGAVLADPWDALLEWPSTQRGYLSDPADARGSSRFVGSAEAQRAFIRRYGASEKVLAAETTHLLDGAVYRQQMLTSCPWFWDDLDRPEPKAALGFARAVVNRLPPEMGMAAERQLLDRLDAIYAANGRSAGELYRERSRLARERHAVAS